MDNKKCLYWSNLDIVWLPYTDSNDDYDHNNSIYGEKLLLKNIMAIEYFNLAYLQIYRKSSSVAAANTKSNDRKKGKLFQLKYSTTFSCSFGRRRASILFHTFRRPSFLPSESLFEFSAANKIYDRRWEGETVFLSKGLKGGILLKIATEFRDIGKKLLQTLYREKIEMSK